MTTATNILVVEDERPPPRALRRPRRHFEAEAGHSSPDRGDGRADPGDACRQGGVQSGDAGADWVTFLAGCETAGEAIALAGHDHGVNGDEIVAGGGDCGRSGHGVALPAACIALDGDAVAFPGKWIVAGNAFMRESVAALASSGDRVATIDARPRDIFVAWAVDVAIHNRGAASLATSAATLDERVATFP